MVLLVLSGLCAAAGVALMVIGVVGAGGGKDAAMDARMARRQERLDHDEPAPDDPATDPPEAPTSLAPRTTSRPAGGAGDAAA